MNNKMKSKIIKKNKRNNTKKQYNEKERKI